MSLDLLLEKLPEVDAWVDRTLAEHASQARSVESFGFARLAGYYPVSLLRTAKVVGLPRVPMPPLSRMGLLGFEEFENLNAAGITYKDTYFVCASHLREEALHFHELVHVVQWQHLGVRNFILAYALGHLLGGGYDGNPLERTAYALQARFDAGEASFDAPAHARSDAERDCRALLRQVGLG